MSYRILKLISTCSIFSRFPALPALLCVAATAARHTADRTPCRVIRRSVVRQSWLAPILQAKVCGREPRQRMRQACLATPGSTTCARPSRMLLTRPLRMHQLARTLRPALVPVHAQSGSGSENDRSEARRRRARRCRVASLAVLGSAKHRGKPACRQNCARCVLPFLPIARVI